MFARETFDACVVMIHDQGHIPGKLEQGSAGFAIGTPIVFASVAHGSAHDIAASAAVIAFASLALTQLLDKATRDGSLPRIAIITGNDDAAMRMASLPRPTGNSPGVGGQYDDTPVGSIAGRPMPRVVLDPCTGKNR